MVKLGKLFTIFHSVGTNMNNKKIVLYAKLFLGSTLSVFLIFFSWKVSYSYHCLSLVFPLIMLLIISYGYIELKMEERACFKKCYFKEHTFFSRVLSSRFFVTLFFIFVSTAMTVSSFTASIDFPKLLWLYFIVHVLLSIFLFTYLKYIFGKIFQTQYQLIFAREWTSYIMGIILILVFVYISLNGYEPLYLRDSLHETISNARNTVSSSCNIISYMLEVGKTIDSSFWWIVNESAKQAQNVSGKAGLWFTFLFYNSLALLGINRLIMQIIYMLNKIFNDTEVK